MKQDKKIVLSEIIEKREDVSLGNHPLDDKKHNLPEKEEVGQLMVDVYKKGNNVIIKTIVAGVDPKDLDISLSGDIITLRGKRFLGEEVDSEDYYCQECYWGKFSRSIILPFKVDEDNMEAILKNGILTLIIPGIKSSNNTKIHVKEID